MRAKEKRIAELTQKLAAAEAERENWHDSIAFQEAIRKISDLTKKLEAAEQDTARLDWLEEYATRPAIGHSHVGIHVNFGQTFRDAIDFARKDSA